LTRAAAVDAPIFIRGTYFHISAKNRNRVITPVGLRTGMLIFGDRMSAGESGGDQEAKSRTEAFTAEAFHADNCWTTRNLPFP
jgi:hypothetical protein